MAGNSKGGKEQSYDALTEHQLRLLTLAAYGMTSPEIGRVFRVGQVAVRMQLRRIRLKLGAKNTTNAVYIAFCDKSRQEEEGGDEQ